MDEITFETTLSRVLLSVDGGEVDYDLTVTAELDSGFEGSRFEPSYPASASVVEIKDVDGNEFAVNEEEMEVLDEEALENAAQEEMDNEADRVDYMISSYREE